MRERQDVKRLWVLLCAAFVDMMGYAIVFPLLPFYAVRLGGNAQIVGLLVACFSIAQVASSPLWGRFSDRWGRRPALLVSLAGSSLAFLIFGLASSVWLLFASRLTQGASGGTTGVMQAYVGDSVPPEERAKALGWLSAATNAGVMVGPAIGSLSWSLGPAAPGLFAAALCFVNLLFAWRWLPESRPRGGPLTAPPAAAKKSVGKMVWETLRHPGTDVARLIWIYAVSMAAFSSLTSVLGLYLMEQFDLTEATIGYVFVFIGGFSVALRAGVLGRVISALGEVQVMRMGAMLLTVGLAAYPIPNNFWTLVPVMALVPLGTAFLFPATSGLLSRRGDKHQLGQLMGVQQSFGGMARIVGPIWAGAAFGYFGPSVPFLVGAALVSGVVLLTTRIRKDSPVSQSALQEA
jgi:MFS family permease